MAVALQYLAQVPPKESAERRMPKGPGVHIAVNKSDFGGKAAEKGRWVLQKGRQTPLPAPDKDEDKKPTYAPGQNEPLGIRQTELRELTKSDVESDDLPTYGPGKKTTPTPAPQRASEEKMLHSESTVAMETNSFAPPPPVSIPDMGRIIAFTQDGTAHKIIAKREKKKPEAPEENERPSISPRKGLWVLLESSGF